MNLQKGVCPECFQPHWFRHWVGQHCAQASAGLGVLDFDLMFHRFRLSQDYLGTREVEHMMIVEVKVSKEMLRPAQRDTLSVFNGLLSAMIPVNGSPIGVNSRPGFIKQRAKKIVWHGIHLCRVPFDYSPAGPFSWDNKFIEPESLVSVLNFENDPNKPSRKLDVDRRHKRNELVPSLFEL